MKRAFTLIELLIVITMGLAQQRLVFFKIIS